jgi:hypothetical protein
MDEYLVVLEALRDLVPLPQLGEVCGALSPTQRQARIIVDSYHRMTTVNIHDNPVRGLKGNVLANGRAG